MEKLGRSIFAPSFFSIKGKNSIEFQFSLSFTDRFLCTRTFSRFSLVLPFFFFHYSYSNCVRTSTNDRTWAFSLDPYLVRAFQITASCLASLSRSTQRARKSKWIGREREEEKEERKRRDLKTCSNSRETLQWPRQVGFCSQVLSHLSRNWTEREKENPASLES